MLRIVLVHMCCLICMQAADPTLSITDLEKSGAWTGDGRLIIRDASTLLGGREALAKLALARALSSVDCRSAQVAPNDLLVLAGLPVRELTVDGNVNFTDEHLAVAGKMISLEYLDVGKSGCSSSGVAALRLPALRQMRVSGMTLGHPILFGLPSVRLALASDCQIEAGALAAPVNSQLSFLNIARSRIAGGSLGPLKAFPALAELCAIDCVIPAQDVIAISECAALRNLDCESAMLEGGFAPILRMKNLQTLNLSRIAVGDAFVAEVLAALPALNTLLLSGTEITDKAMRAVAESPSVDQLAISDSRVTVHGLEVLRQSKHITGLAAANLSIGDDGIIELFGKGWDALQEVDFSGNGLTDVCVPALGKASALKRINLSGNGFSVAGAKELHRLLPQTQMLIE